MGATTVIAIAGVVTTALTALGVPFVQGRVAARSAVAVRIDEARLAAYTDAMSHVQKIESRVDESIEDPDFRSNSTAAEVVHRDLVTARLRLLASASIVERWSALMTAWDVLAWNAEQDGPVNHRGDYHLRPDDPEVVRVREATRDLIEAFRRELGPR